MAKHLQRSIDELKTKIINMSGDVEDRLYQAAQSVLKRDPKMAEAVIKGDADIDQTEVDIEEECLKILALFQPVAIDLRFIIAILKINNDLERIGDLAVNIAERSLYLATHDPITIPFDMDKMATKVEWMVTKSIDSLVQLDVKLARQVRSMDDEVDKYNREMYSRVKDDLPVESEQVSCLLHALSIGRHLERIADHATNIAEDVIYLVEAEIIRHRPEVFEE